MHDYPHLEERIENLKVLFSSHSHRYIPIGTSDLMFIVMQETEIAHALFVQKLKEAFERDNLVFNEESEPVLHQQFEKDFLNNDLPLFHYLPSRGECLYNGIVVGYKRNS